MLLPRILSTLLLLIAQGTLQVNTDNRPCIFSNVSSTRRSCNKFNHTDGPALVSKRRVRRQTGRSGLGGCGNEEIKSIMDRVMPPLLNGGRMKIGDIAKRLQTAVQQGTGKSYEIFMGKGEMHFASHQTEVGASCKQRVGEFFTTVYETPIQYNIFNLEQEQFLANIDFGEPLGGSGYPGQEPFPQLVRTPVDAGTNALGEAGGAAGTEQAGRANAEPAGGPNAEGCDNPRLSGVMNRVLPSLLNATQRMRIKDIARTLQLAVQNETGKSFEIFMGRSEMTFSSHQDSPSTSCKMRIGGYYTTMYETPVQYDISDADEEQFMANVDFGQGFDGGPRLGGCESEQLYGIMTRVAPPLVNAPQRMRMGDIARTLQLAVQNETGKSFEVFMGRSEMSFSSYQITPLTSCRMWIGEYYTTMYETPVQHDISNAFEERFMANIDFGQALGGSGYPGQIPFPQYSALQGPMYQPPPPVFAQMQCFSGDLMVETAEGPKRMDALKIGDEVLSIDENMISFSPIIMFLHRDEELMAEFNVITTETGKSLKLTNEHLIFVSDCDNMIPLRLVKAKAVTADDCVISSQTSTYLPKHLNVDRVINVSKVYERGIFSPLTSTGDIIVNDILSSCHSNLGVRTLQQSVLRMYLSIYRTLSFFLLEEESFPVGLAFLTSTLDIFLPGKITLG